MAFEIKMPQLSDTMHEGKILQWRKKEGDAVKRGEILAEVETDKANLEIEAFHAGTLLKIMTPAHSVAHVGEVICFIGNAGESIAAAPSKAAPAPAAATSATTAEARPAAMPPPQQAPVDEHTDDDRIRVSPLARKVAQQRNIDLSVVKGTGPNGRIVKKDLDAAAAAPSRSPSPARSAPRRVEAAAAERNTVERRTEAAPGGGHYEDFSKMRATIARRMVESVTQAPHFYVTTSINMGEANRLRSLLKERAGYQGISLNHLVIKAAAYALSQEPRVNNAVRDDRIYIPDQINIGIITAIEDGLLIPVIKEADTLPLKDLVFEARAAVERARAGRPSASDLSGGTFSISNMGMFDVENFTAIINPGQGAVLAVSSMKEEPIVQNGQVVIGQMMKATISVDHRIIDGVMAGTFLKHFKEGLETPALITL